MLLCLVGLPGSGKTTWAKDFCDGFEPDDSTRFYRISSDDLRMMIYNAPNIVSPVEFDLLDVCVCELLKQNKNVLIDATNLKKKHRAKWASIARMEGREFEVRYFNIFPAECISNNENRSVSEGYVPPEIIVRMSESFEVPTASEGNVITVHDE